MIDQYDPRYQALVLANAYGGETIDQTMQRAKRYLRFLDTETKETLADPNAPVTP